MKRFAYGSEPLCVAACLIYAGTRWLVPEAWKGLWWQSYFADLLLLPAAFPWLLWMQRRLGLRNDDAPPRWSEIFGTLLVWTLAAEVVAPFLFSRATGDPWDGVAYAVGAVTTGLWWCEG